MTLTPELMQALGPRYWRDETSGHLARAVKAYLANRPLSANDITLMREYLRQWVMAPIWDRNPQGNPGLQGLRDLIPSLTNRAQITTWLVRALTEGIDPL